MSSADAPQNAKTSFSSRVQDDAKARGREDEIGGLPCYISEPLNGSHAASLVFLTNVFGWQPRTTRLLADEYARAGFYVYVPDLFEGDSLSPSLLEYLAPSIKDQETRTTIEKAKGASVATAAMGPWLLGHREGVVRPMIDGFVNAVRFIPGTDRVGVVGFGWGGRYAVLQAHGRSMDPAATGGVGGADVAVSYSPSYLSIPTDFEGVAVPLSVAVGSKDKFLDLGKVDEVEQVLKKKDGVPYEVKVYEDQVNDFALRTDWSSDTDKKAMDDAIQQGIDWLKRHL